METFKREWLIRQETSLPDGRKHVILDVWDKSSKKYVRTEFDWPLQTEKSQKMLNKNLDKLRKYEKQFKVKFKIPGWEDSAYQERLLRFGLEFQQLALECPYDSKTQQAVQNSLIEDILKEIELCLTWNEPLRTQFINRMAKR